MKKRVALIQLGKTLFCSCGITTFVNNFIYFAKENDIWVDVISDENLSSKPLMLDSEHDNLGFYYPAHPLSSKVDVKLRGHFTYNVSLETQINFRDALFAALKDNVYDMILINSEDAIPAVFNMGLSIPTYVYTHFTSLVYPDAEQRIFDNLHAQTGLYKDIFPTLTQTELTKTLMEKNGFESKVAPLFIHPSFLENLNREPNSNAEGLLFVGRLASEKNFDKFVKVVAKLGCKAWVMTGERNREKASEQLRSAGVRNFEIGTDLTGQDRIEFMRKAKACFHPAHVESYGYAAYESLHIHRCILLAEKQWTQAFEGLANILPEEFVTGGLKSFLSQPVEVNKDALLELHAQNTKIWLDLFDEVEEKWKQRPGRSSRAKESLASGSMSVRTFYERVLKREPTFSDQDSLHKQIKTNHIQVRHIKNSTLLSLDGNFESQQETTLDSFFS